MRTILPLSLVLCAVALTSTAGSAQTYSMRQKMAKVPTAATAPTPSTPNYTCEPSVMGIWSTNNSASTKNWNVSTAAAARSTCQSWVTDNKVKGTCAWNGSSRIAYFYPDQFDTMPSAAQHAVSLCR